MRRGLLLVGVLMSAMPVVAGDVVPRRVASTIAAPLVQAVPTIDGKLDDAVWNQAQPLREFAYGKGARYATEAWVCRDAKNFYFAARCFDDNLEGLITENEGGSIWRNDCVELFVAPEKKRLFYAHLIVSCDGKTMATTWVPDEWGEPTRGKDPNLQCKTGREKDAWTLELSVPITAFGHAIKPDSVWSLGFNREKHSDPSEVSSFQGGFHKPEQYPDLVFDNRTVVVDGVGLKNLGRKAESVKVMLKATAEGGPQKEVALTLAPGKRAELPWQATFGKLEAGQGFTVDTLGADGKLRVHEAYKLVAIPKTIAPVDPNNIPPAKFELSVLDDPNFFPIAVWAQPAGPAAAYKKMGVNVFVGGVDAYPNPKDKAYMDAIYKHGQYAIIPFKRKYLEMGLNKHPAFVAWMFGDEPDNVNAATGKVKHTPEELLGDFARIRAADPAHPVYMNLGCGVAHERFLGRGASDEQYAQYPKACDIVCFDVYPCNSIQPNGPDRLHLVAKGIDRLRKWGGPKKRVWAWIEANKFGKGAEGREPTPDEVKTEIWMALVHGANGYGFFCHSWSKTFLSERMGSKRKFSCSAIAKDMQEALAKVNGEVLELAPVLNSPTVADGATVKTTQGSRVDTLVKNHKGAVYVFAVNMYRKAEKPAITVKGVKDGQADVLYENRTVEVKGGQIVDSFPPYAVHRYKITQ